MKECARREDDPRHVARPVPVDPLPRISGEIAKTLSLGLGLCVTLDWR
jgi:hypothetical protein